MLSVLDQILGAMRPQALTWTSEKLELTLSRRSVRFQPRVSRGLFETLYDKENWEIPNIGVASCVTVCISPRENRIPLDRREHQAPYVSDRSMPLFVSQRLMKSPLRPVLFNGQVSAEGWTQPGTVTQQGATHPWLKETYSEIVS